jgi:hypothetical protein
MEEINALGKSCIVNSPHKVWKTLTELLHTWRGYNPNRDPLDDSPIFSVEKYIDVEKLQKNVSFVVRKFNEKKKRDLQVAIVEKTISLSKKLATFFAKNPEKYEVRSFETPNSPDGLLLAEGCVIHAAVRNNPFCVDGIREMMQAVFSWAKKQRSREIACHNWDELKQKVLQDLDTLTDSTKSDEAKRSIDLNPWKPVLWAKALWEIEEKLPDATLQEWNSYLDGYAAAPREFKEYLKGYLYAFPTRNECSLFVKQRKIRPYYGGANLYLGTWNKAMPFFEVSTDESLTKLGSRETIIFDSTVDHRFRAFFVEKKN